MGLPRLSTAILLLLASAIAFVLYQSALPVSIYFLPKGGGGTRLVSLGGFNRTPDSPHGPSRGGEVKSQKQGGGRQDPKLQTNGGTILGKEIEEEEELFLDWGTAFEATEVLHPDVTSVSDGQIEKTADESALSEGVASGQTDSRDGSERTVEATAGEQTAGETSSVWRESEDKPIIGAQGTVIKRPPKPPNDLTCKEWMTWEWRQWEEGFRDFTKEPVNIVDAGFRSWFETTQEELSQCDIGCELHEAGSIQAPDATTEHWVGEVQSGPGSGLIVLRNVESFTNYPSVATDRAKAAGVDIVSNFHLDSDVPHVYFSWSGCAFNLRGKDCAGLEIMSPLHKKEVDAAAAFISNCEAKNFRTEAVKGLIENDVAVKNYGDCVHTADLPGGDVKGYDESKYGSKYHNKLVEFQRHKFALAFENSCEEDYVTEKFFHALAAGSVPVVVGAPNTRDFAPATNSYLQIGSVEEIPAIAEKMRYLMQNNTAYNEMLAWKTNGPSDEFRALMDLQAVHPTCRLCQHVAFLKRKEEEDRKRKREGMPPCHCQETLNGKKQSSYVVLIRERGVSEFRPLVLNALVLRGGVASLEAAILEDFKRANHKPVWLKTRTAAGVESRDWRVYRVYPAGLTQKEALHHRTARESHTDLVNFLLRNSCPKLEVIFV